MTEPTSLDGLVRILATDHARGGHTETALLDSLEDACSGVRSIGAGGRKGGGGIPINGDAVDLVATIRGDLLGDLARLSAPIRYGTLGSVLEQWHDAWRASAPTAGEEAAWLGALAAWNRDIRRVIATHERAPVQDGSCPICGQTRFMRDDAEQWALVREWEHDDPHGSMRLTCLPCGEVLAYGSRAVAASLGINFGAAVAQHEAEAV